MLQKGPKFGVSGIFGESTLNLGERNKQSLGMRLIFLCFSEIIFLNEKETSLEGKLFYVGSYTTYQKYLALATKGI